MFPALFEIVATVRYTSTSPTEWGEITVDVVLAVDVITVITTARVGDTGVVVVTSVPTGDRIASALDTVAGIFVA
jgi:hypothetical protein